MLEQVPACIHPLLHPLTQLCFVNLSVSLSDHKQGREKWLPDLHWLFLLALTFSFLLLEKCWIVSSQLVLSVWWNCLWKTQSVASSLPLHKAFVIRMEWPSPAIWCQVFLFQSNHYKLRGLGKSTSLAKVKEQCVFAYDESQMHAQTDVILNSLSFICFPSHLLVVASSARLWSSGWRIILLCRLNRLMTLEFSGWVYGGSA